MTNTVSRQLGQVLTVGRRGAVAESAWVRVTLILVLFMFLALFLFMPLAGVFAEVFKKDADAYLEMLIGPDASSAIYLTLTTAAIAVLLNVVSGVAATWAIVKFEFRGKNPLLTLIDLPFSVSLVIAGLIYVLLFGVQGWFGPYLSDHDLKVILAMSGIMLAIVFATFPFMACEPIPLVQTQGSGEEEMVVVLDVSGWQTFFHATLSNIKWGLLYGVILCNTRAMGGLGAMSAVSDHIRGLTNTIPLYVEILYNEHNFVAVFVVALLLTLLMLVMLALEMLVGWYSHYELADADTDMGEGPGARVAASSSSSNPNSCISAQSPLEGSAV